VAVGVGYFIYKYFDKTPGTMAEKLEQLGVQVPKHPSIGAAGGSPVPFDPQPKAAPIQKIILDDADPTPYVPTPAPTPATLVSEPSLITAAGVSLPISEGETIVGRDAGLGLSLTGESSISRKHASIVKTGENVMVTDLGSTNGTFVNGAKLSAPTTLRSGDSVQFGAVIFQFRS
jgi:hypothetical protein